MKNKRFVPLFLLLFLLVVGSSFCFYNYEKGTLVVTVTNLEAGAGLVRMGIYKKGERFLVERGSLGKSVTVKPGTNFARLEVPNLDFDTYALAVYQDLNGNYKLDLNALGIPAEPYGFTNPIKSKWRRPTFEEMKFSFSNNNQSLVIPVKRWINY